MISKRLLAALSAPVLLLALLAPSAQAATKDGRPEIVQCFTDFPPAGCSDVTPAGLARKLLLKAKVTDTVGNRATVKQKAKLTLP